MTEFKPIGTIRTPFTELAGMPIQPAGATGIRGTIHLLEEYRQGLRDLDGFSHIVLLFVFHRSDGYKLEVVPFMDTVPRGLFSTRAPKRPNPIGLSVVQLNRIQDGILHIQNVDMLDGTPLLDIKPYVPEFDSHANIRTGWLEQARKTVDKRKSDDRFIKQMLEEMVRQQMRDLEHTPGMLHLLRAFPLTGMTPIRKQDSCYVLETFTKSKKFVEAPHFSELRRRSLLHLATNEIDAPIAGLIDSFTRLPYCFTLQSCYGHFLYPGQKDHLHIGTLSAVRDTTVIEYRIAYVAICLDNSSLGKGLYESLNHVTDIDPDYIQFGCAEWFWQRSVNSYVLQVEPMRDMTKDTAVIGYSEALYIDKVRRKFFDRLNELMNEQLSIVALEEH